MKVVRTARMEMSVSENAPIYCMTTSVTVCVCGCACGCVCASVSGYRVSENALSTTMSVPALCTRLWPGLSDCVCDCVCPCQSASSPKTRLVAVSA
jgi:hypothetical protein